ncbi:TIGR00725 family protein [Cellulomonas fengjieae]|uniref:TIGR00725 family protein n=1 Tax=Cellulomonas fengjieae TaxID=2819978 RepID=A0ABS3SHN5_9CELL|nr:TIGR00725 family protein [Cellulomonas fengjieae]MBO3085263.1 TIGR00725 family protein [Cellulomonas fengjieae]QVI66173.1 TIGR00725 family protein [Cellulomonas fengjieae]
MSYVGVVGPSRASEAELGDAEALGRGLAERGHVVVCGGLGGVMEAAARGAAQAGGVVVGLLPGADRADANPYVTVAIPTGLGELRNALLVRSSDVVVSVGGSWGTLSEVALAVRTGLPVVAVRGWGLDGPAPGAGPRDVASVDEALSLLDALPAGARTIGVRDVPEPGAAASAP